MTQIEAANRILAQGNCDAVPCGNCPAKGGSSTTYGCYRADSNIPFSKRGGLDAQSRAWFEQWLAAHDEPQKFKPENQYTLSNVSAREIINLNAQMAAFMQEYGVHCVRPLPGNRIESRASIRARLLDL
jgi:hypothetical protein